MNGNLDKQKLLEYLKEKINLKDKQINRLEAEGTDTESALYEWYVYKRIIEDIEKGIFDSIDPNNLPESITVTRKMTTEEVKRVYGVDLKLGEVKIE